MLILVNSTVNLNGVNNNIILKLNIHSNNAFLLIEICQESGVDSIIPIVRYYKDNKMISQFDKDMKKEDLVKLINEADNTTDSDNNEQDTNSHNATDNKQPFNSDASNYSDVRYLIFSLNI
jgi:hypothetical protein